jgi:hypothetical protein
MKVLCLVSLVCIVSSAIGQDSVTIKPVRGETNFEVNFNPFSSTPININYLRFRRYVSDRTAVRLGASVSGRSENPSEDLRQSTSIINLRPGFEWHFKGTERLSPFLGIEADFAFKNASVESTQSGNEYEISGAWSVSGVERGFARLGANLVIGADIYIIKRVYLGTEIGFGFTNTSFKDIELKSGSTTNEFKGGSTFQYGPNFNSSLRLGFVF